eukprot:gb/GEZN01023444.1/.p1 GENE.gb/GEZN01023444.1/~~gb/GEZN01023444.1/.p1  ORF type:complete len:167 (-),score=20.26 gb/GEZN01023444.1/:93-566(-)
MPSKKARSKAKRLARANEVKEKTAGGGEKKDKRVRKNAVKISDTFDLHPIKHKNTKNNVLSNEQIQNNELHNFIYVKEQRMECAKERLIKKGNHEFWKNTIENMNEGGIWVWKDELEAYRKINGKLQPFTANGYERLKPNMDTHMFNTTVIPPPSSK